jgi:hypothetical protein
LESPPLKKGDLGGFKNQPYKEFLATAIPAGALIGIRPASRYQRSGWRRPDKSGVADSRKVERT